MAKPTNSVVSTDEVGLREDLEGVVYRVAVEETPFTANIQSGPRAKNIRHEWELDTLAAADTTNAQAEGDNVVADAVVQPTRVANICQIKRKAVSTSGTTDALDEVANYSTVAVQLVKKGLELRRDSEAIFLMAQSASAADPRKMGSFPAWITTNVNAGSGRTAASLSSGLPVKATDGTQRAFTETIVKDVLQQCYKTRGRTPKILMVGPFNKGVFSGFAGIASSRFNVQKDAPTTVIGAADVYVGDFGNLTVMPNIFQREREALFVDFDMVSRVPLRPMTKRDLAVTGDSNNSFLVVEDTLKVHNEAAHGIAADLLTS